MQVFQETKLWYSSLEKWDIPFTDLQNLQKSPSDLELS